MENNEVTFGWHRKGNPSFVSKPHVETGSKSDEGKTKMSLLMVGFGSCVMDVAKVLTFGALKYPKPPLDDNWRDVPNGKQRYQDALYRHLHAVLVDSEWVDEESGLPHFAHAITNILFLWKLGDDDGK